MARLDISQARSHDIDVLSRLIEVTRDSANR